MINFRGEDVSNINAWQVPYANLMTILMIFFMILYSFYHVTGSTKYEQIINSIQEEFGYELESKDMERLRRIKNEEDMQKAVREFRQRKGLRQFTQVRVEQEKISIILSDPILFTSGSDELKSETIWILSELADILRGVKENEEISRCVGDCHGNRLRQLDHEHDFQVGLRSGEPAARAREA